MNTTAPAIDVRNVFFQFANDLLALDCVSLTVQPGEIVALVGPSGCGKSTLLNAIAGLLQPSSGTIAVEGDSSPKRLGRFSYLPQRDGLLPWRTAVDNAALLLEVQGAPMRQAQAAALDMLREFGLEPFADALPRTLSGGMRQRIALIRTFLPGHNVLMDEPFSALDAITRSDLHEWLMGIHVAKGRAILLVTHDVDEALFLADRVYVMSSRPGKVIHQLETMWGRPRPLSIRTTPAFGEKKAELLEVLRQAARRDEPSWAA